MISTKKSATVNPPTPPYYPPLPLSLPPRGGGAGERGHYRGGKGGFLKKSASLEEKKTGHSTQEVGSAGEDIAEKYLRSKGFSIIERNFRFRGGEIDLIAERKGELHFVEVKTRRSGSFGDPLQSIGRSKQAHLSRSAQMYLVKNDRWKSNPKCFSVLVVLENQEKVVEFIPNAFELAGNYY